MPGRIHISQATADELILMGKKSWLIAREELVEAKGKGSLQCYFVEVASAQHSSADGAGSGSAACSNASVSSNFDLGDFDA